MEDFFGKNFGVGFNDEINERVGRNCSNTLLFDLKSALVGVELAPIRFG